MSSTMRRRYKRKMLAAGRRYAWVAIAIRDAFTAENFYRAGRRIADAQKRLIRRGDPDAFDLLAVAKESLSVMAGEIRVSMPKRAFDPRRMRRLIRKGVVRTFTPA